MQSKDYDYAFIACVKTKLKYPAKARDLYISPLFRKAYKYAQERTNGGGSNIFILSAKYGLIHSEQIISPYEKTLNSENKKERKIWSFKILKTMQELRIPYNSRILILAGQNYREYIMQKLPNSYCPLKGLSMGNILRFYNQNL